MTDATRLPVFLCHASQDKPVVRDLYRRLCREAWIGPWLDEEKLLPGQDWDLEIEKAVEPGGAVIVCLSSRSVTKEGYVQKELRKVLDIALEKPEETLFINPLRLDDCKLPRRLRSWHYVGYFPADRQDWAFRCMWEFLDYSKMALAVPTGLSFLFRRHFPASRIFMVAFSLFLIFQSILLYSNHAGDDPVVAWPIRSSGVSPWWQPEPLFPPLGLPPSRLYIPRS